MRQFEIKQGNALDVLRTMPDESVQTCVTSPPYWGLRNYGTEPQIWGGEAGCEHQWDVKNIRDTRGNEGSTLQGARNMAQTGRRVSFTRGACSICGAWRGHLGLEPTPEMFIEHMVSIFREVHRVLRADGTLWLNIGDSYATGGGSVGRCPGGGAQGERFLRQGHIETQPNRMPLPGYKPKDLVGIPWMLAFALRANGYYLRSDIIWHKPNPMPESVTDRPTKSHEYIFLLSKSERYYYDQDAIREKSSDSTHARLPGNRNHKGTTAYQNGAEEHRTKAGLVVYAERQREKHRKLAEAGSGIKNNGSFDAAMAVMPEVRNKRSVWTVTTHGYSEAHFATFPPKLIEPCILAGCPPGGTVLDPFNGAGTTGLVALRHDRNYIGIELNPEYIEMSRRRILSDAPLFNQEVA